MTLDYSLPFWQYQSSKRETGHDQPPEADPHHLYPDHHHPDPGHDRRSAARPDLNVIEQRMGTDMTFKHQTESYRTRNGVRFECAEDLCDLSQGDLRWQAQEMVRGHRDHDRQAFFEKHDGFYRVFVAR